MTGGVDASSLETSRQKIAAAARGLVALSAGGPSALTARVDDVGRYVDALGAEARRLSFAGLRRATDALSDAVSSWRHAGGAPERAPTALARVAELLLSGANEAPERWDAWSLETRAELIALLGAVALGVSAAGGAPTSAARKAPSGAPPPDADLIDLFLSELESGMPRLLELVLALEDDGASISAREEAMRLVHSLKGAARIVGLLSVVTVLHAAEDMLSPATRAHALSSADAGNLLRLVDLLAALSGLSGARVAVWVTQHQAELSELGDALRRPATAGPAASAALAPASPIGSHTGAATGVGPTQADPRALRVNADVLSRLLGLAGETVVEARRLSSWPRSNVGLERLHGRLASRADEILRRAAALGDGGLVSVAEGLIAEVGEASRLFHESRHATSDGLQRLLDAGERLYLESLRARQRPFAQLVPALRRQVRDSAKALGKIAKLEIHGAAIPVDGDVLTSLEPMLTHLVTNALDHGIEPEALRTANGKAPHGTLRIDLKHVRGQLALTVGDDGAGIDPERVRAKVIEGRHVDELTARALDESELFEFLFLPAFSTASAVSVHSGRGVGLDAVRTEVTRLGGRIALHSQRGKGTRFELTLPLTRVVVRALLVQVSGEAYALPLARAGRVVRVPLSEVHSSEGRDYVELDGENVGVVRADDLLEVGPAAPSTGDLTLVLLGEEGTFVICSFWLVSCLAMAGEIARAEALFAQLTGYANDLGLLAEEIDTAAGEQLGNFPQAFSHIGLIRAAADIDRANDLR